MYNKFSENDGEKAKHVCSLYKGYLEKMKVQEMELEAEKQEWIQEVQEDTEISEEQRDSDLQDIIEEFYMKKLAVGLFTLQLSALIIGYLIASQNAKLLEAIDHAFKDHSITLVSVEAVLSGRRKELL